LNSPAYPIHTTLANGGILFHPDGFMSESLDSPLSISVPGPPAKASPVAPQERLDVIDILRGMALFGIITANMRGFDAPAEVYFNITRLFPAHADRVAQNVVNVVFQGKFITLFSFLFGLGFAAQMSRAAQRGTSVSFYPRRLTVLLIIGLIHSWLIWWGDILVGYALMGFVLFLFRSRSQKTVAIWAFALAVVDLITPTGSWIWAHFHPAPLAAASMPSGASTAARASALQHVISIYRDGSYFAITKQRFQDWATENWPPIYLVTFVFPRFLAGLWVWRTGVFQNLEARRPLIKRLCWAGLAIGVLAYAWTLVPQGRSTFLSLTQDYCRSLTLLALACFYACLVMLAVQNPIWKKRLLPFGAVGRMALTNYITQSLVCTWLFRLTHLYGKVGPLWDFVPTIIVYGLQIPLSVWWLSQHQYGPLEWLWRSLTYGKAQPMRRIQNPPEDEFAMAQA
jgi:uncharacterized protein